MTVLARVVCAAALLGACMSALASPLGFVELNGGAVRTFADLRGGPHAIVVWKASCAPCVEELGHLREIAARASDWHFVTLALDDAKTAREALPAGALISEAWVARDEATTVLAALNPTEPALPLTIAVDRHGKICARRVGLLGSDILAGWRAQCSR